MATGMATGARGGVGSARRSAKPFRIIRSAMVVATILNTGQNEDMAGQSFIEI